MKKKRKSNLDEMQEQKLLKIEHIGCWIAFWGLLLAMLVQMFIYGPENAGYAAGEWIVFMVLAVYLVISCIKNGIWDRKIMPDMKSNVIVSCIASAVMAGLMFAVTYKNYKALYGSIATGVFTFIMMFVLVLAVLSAAASIYRNRVNKLENMDESREE